MDRHSLLLPFILISRWAFTYWYNNNPNYLLCWLQPLATCMHNLQLGKMAIGLQISEPWLREYQVWFFACFLCTLWCGSCSTFVILYFFANSNRHLTVKYSLLKCYWKKRMCGIFCINIHFNILIFFAQCINFVWCAYAWERERVIHITWMHSCEKRTHESGLFNYPYLRG